jgi:predicted PurR-regulated permease PerM
MEDAQRELRELKPPQFLKYLIFSAALTLLLIIIYYLRSVLTPIFLSFIIAYALNPAVDWLERKKIRRPLAVTTFFFAFFLMVFIAVLLLIPAIQQEVDFLLSGLPQYLRSFQEEGIPKLERMLGRDLPSNFDEFLTRMIARFSNLSFDALKPLGSFALRVVSNLLDFIINLLNFILIPLFTFYFMRDYHKLKRIISDLVPVKNRNSSRSTFKEIDSILGNFIRGQITVCLILAVLYSIGLYFIDIDLAIVVGVFSGLLFIVPYMGTILGVVFSSLLALLKFGDLSHLIYVWGWFGFVQLLEGYYITPKLVGKKLGLHPMVVIVALLIGGKIMGLLGILLAVPITAVLKIFIKFFLQSYKNSSFFLGT